MQKEKAETKIFFSDIDAQWQNIGIVLTIC